MSTEIDDALEIPTSRSRSRYVSFGGGFVDGMQGGMRLAKQVQAMYRQDEADKIAREKVRRQAVADDRTGKGLDQTVPTADPAAPVPAAMPAQQAQAMPISNNLDAVEQRPLDAAPAAPTQTAQSDLVAQNAVPSEYADSWQNMPAAPDTGALAQNNFEGTIPAMERPEPPTRPAMA